MNLDILMKKSGVTGPEIASALDVNLSTVNGWRQGRMWPTAENLIKLAELFGVSLDYLMGRCTEQEAEEIKADYKVYFRTRQEDAYLRWLSLPKNPAPEFPGKAIAPWPYNLLEEVFCDRWEKPLDPFQEDGLDEALSRLTVRENTMVKLYYESGLTLEAIGQQYSLCRDRVRQIILKAVRKMRHPVRSKLILNGYDKTGREKQLRNYEEALSQKQAELEDRERYLAQKDAELTAREKQFTSNLGAESFADAVKRQAVLEEPIENLELSVRAFNCLYKKGFRTLADILAYKGPFGVIRNLGRGTFAEIQTVVKEKTGEEIVF